VTAYDRDYEPVHLVLNQVGGNREARMRALCDTLWRYFKDYGVSWVGFYTLDTPTPPTANSEAQPEPQMVLGPSRDSPACSPIGMHGACGMALTKKRSLVINDVQSLGTNYIACNPKDRSEIVVPIYDERGRAYGVLDLDSFDRSAFGEADVRALKRLLEATAISWPSPWVTPLYY
jgi:putative methionine-R-sulfoxide reductase with GAF domain